MPGRRPAIPCCSRRPAPASTNSRITNTAGGYLSKSYRSSKPEMPQQAKTDKPLFAATVGLVFFGLVMVYSASSIIAMQDPRYHSSAYFVIRHAIYLGPALLLMMFLKWKHYSKLRTPAIAFIAVGSVIILLFLVYFLDPHNHR